MRVSHSREGDPRCRSERLGRGEGCQRACGMSRPERRLDSSTRRRGLPAPDPCPAPALRRGGRCRSRRRCRSRCARDPAPLADGKVSLPSLGSEGAKPEPCSWRRRDLESARKGGRRRAEGGSEGEEKKGRRQFAQPTPSSRLGKKSRQKQSPYDFFPLPLPPSLSLSLLKPPSCTRVISRALSPLLSQPLEHHTKCRPPRMTRRCLRPQLSER